MLYWDLVLGEKEWERHSGWARTSPTSSRWSLSSTRLTAMASSTSDAWPDPLPAEASLVERPEMEGKDSADLHVRCHIGLSLHPPLAALPEPNPVAWLQSKGFLAQHPQDSSPGRPPGAFSLQQLSSDKKPFVVSGWR